MESQFQRTSQNTKQAELASLKGTNLFRKIGLFAGAFTLSTLLTLAATRAFCQETANQRRMGEQKREEIRLPSEWSLHLPSVRQIRTSFDGVHAIVITVREFPDAKSGRSPEPVPAAEKRPNVRFPPLDSRPEERNGFWPKSTQQRTRNCSFVGRAKNGNGSAFLEVGREFAKTPVATSQNSWFLRVGGEILL